MGKDGSKCMEGLLNKAKTKKNKQKSRRSKRKRKELSLNIFSTNAAGLKNKIQSFKSEIELANAAIFTVQETHFQKKGKIKIEGFEIFEAIRKKKKDGGTMIGVHKGLKPMLIKEYSEDFEIVVVEINVGGKEIRIISGYGPQETWTEEERMPFFLALEEEINKAELLGKSIVIEMDANSKLGPNYIKQDHTSEAKIAEYWKI